ncbi:MAG TPA: rRNA pseudouridine synthase [Firmicutes bacterium]|nr:rRNA pseudouridine synthase [Bacillota bacterium]
MRLNRYLSACGICSRREADRLIGEGRVKVNGKVITQLGVSVDPSRDKVEVDGTQAAAPSQGVAFAMYKPRGILTTCRDPFGRKTVMDLLSERKVTFPRRLYPVGRLDKESEGLLLITDDGELANLVMHPRYRIEKEYVVEVVGVPDRRALEALGNGVDIGGYKSSPARVKVVGRHEAGAVLQLTMCEGKKREIRLMCKAVGHPVVRLKRTRIGPLALGDMKPGEVRKLGIAEIEAIKQMAMGVGRNENHE